MLTAKEKSLLQYLQDDFPLEERPFDHAARLFGLTESRVLLMLSRLTRRRVIRYLGGIFDPGSLGIRSVLCAMDVEQRRVNDIAGMISGYRQVSHNYLREGHPNLWFTLSASSEKGLRSLLRQIRMETGIKPMALPAVRTFKIDARFALINKKGAGRRRDLPAGYSDRRHVADIDKRSAIELNKPLSIGARPFSRPAAALGLTERRLIARIKKYRDTGILRRFGLILSHRHTGFSVNCMAVWRVAPDAMKAAAAVFKRTVQITHCYERKTLPEWRYNVYTMVHCRSKKECRALIAALSREAGIFDYRLLYTEKEFKKTKADLAAIL